MWIALCGINLLGFICACIFDWRIKMYVVLLVGSFVIWSKIIVMVNAKWASDTWHSMSIGLRSGIVATMLALVVSFQNAYLIAILVGLISARGFHVVSKSRSYSHSSLSSRTVGEYRDDRIVETRSDIPRVYSSTSDVRNSLKSGNSISEFKYNVVSSTKSSNYFSSQASVPTEIHKISSKNSLNAATSSTATNPLSLPIPHSYQSQGSVSHFNQVNLMWYLQFSFFSLLLSTLKSEQ